MSRRALIVAVLVLAGTGRLVAAQPAPAPIVEIRVHGNHSTPDADVIAASGLAVGQPSGDAALTAAAERLRSSGRFRSAEIHRRLRSIDDPDDILVLVMIEELPGASPDLPTPGWLRRTTSGVMWLPVLAYTEGYGVTYGVRVATVDVLGPKSKVSVPLTWGGERKAGLSVERSFERGPFTRLVANGSIRRTEHPAFAVVERRVGGDVRAERVITPWLRAAAVGRLDEVRFAGATSRVSTVGGDLTVDTRLDPSFPRNAVWVTAGLERVGVASTARRRHRIDANAAVGLFRGSALSVRAFQISADGALPAYEQAWIGGASSLRGYRAGARVDDNAAGATVSWALPLGSPMNVARTGLRTFVDWAAVYPARSGWRAASYDRGIGAGVFASATAFTVSLDVARGRDDTRVHLRMGTRF